MFAHNITVASVLNNSTLLDSAHNNTLIERIESVSGSNLTNVDASSTPTAAMVFISVVLGIMILTTVIGEKCRCYSRRT